MKFFILLLMAFAPIQAQADCALMMVRDYNSAMCMPIAMPGMPMRMLMVHVNGFLVGDTEEGARGKDHVSAPNMFMADIGSTLGAHHYFNLEYMGTLEKWTYPKSGYPELLQIGEEDRNGQPFVDAQHPHSSPVMGLTLSDTISLGQESDNIKLFFAPRGESGDGPIAFMHRPTGMVNPDAPLGHHVGQDVGHISSTVIGAAIRKQDTTLQATTFHGAEPQPEDVDLKIGAPNSYAARLIQQVNPHAYAMISAAYVARPEEAQPELSHVWRYSASWYADFALPNEWKWNETFVYGLINGYDNAPALNSFLYEFWLHRKRANFWGRAEVLQRTPDELEIANLNRPNRGRWVEALTLGYTHRLKSWAALDLSAGGSLTKDFVPAAYDSTYDGALSARLFLQVGGMQMWDL